jgi:pseudouridine-5'-phosphate glycosidase
MNGQCYVGLSAAQIEYFGKATDVWKVSLRDMPYVISKRLYGATTVAATIRIASMAGIKVFVTGGIGVYIVVQPAAWIFLQTLRRMAQTSVAVVSAGVKIYFRY